jgi:hypothetical protein
MEEAMSSRPPWEDYQKKDERPPWEDYQAARPAPREDPGMASLREMARSQEGLSADELGEGSPIGRTVGPAMIGAAAVPAMAASPLLRAAGSPAGMAVVRGGAEYAKGGGPLDIANAALRGAGEGAGLRVIGMGLGGALPARLLQWINRGKGAKAAAPVAEAAPAAVVPIAARPPVGAPAATRVVKGQEYVRALNGGWVKAPSAAPVAAPAPAQSTFPNNPAEAAVALSKKAKPPRATVQAESSTLEQQLRESIKLTKGQRGQLAQAQNLEARIVEWKSRQGLSEPQITEALKQTFGIREPGAAKEMVDLVLRAHGLKR